VRPQPHQHTTRANANFSVTHTVRQQPSGAFLLRWHTFAQTHFTYYRRWLALRRHYCWATHLSRRISGSVWRGEITDLHDGSLNQLTADGLVNIGPGRYSATAAMQRRICHRVTPRDSCYHHLWPLPHHHTRTPAPRTRTHHPPTGTDAFATRLLRRLLATKNFTRNLPLAVPRRTFYTHTTYHTTTARFTTYCLPLGSVDLPFNRRTLPCAGQTV